VVNGKILKKSEKKLYYLLAYYPKLWKNMESNKNHNSNVKSRPSQTNRNRFIIWRLGGLIDQTNYLWRTKTRGSLKTKVAIPLQCDDLSARIHRDLLKIKTKKREPDSAE